MRILLAHYPIDDMGGIINHNEQLAAGLQDLGHEVHCRLFLPRSDVPRTGKAGGVATRSPHTGMTLDQRKGYSWPREYCVPYTGRALRDAMEVLESFDIVIWQIPVPTKRKENEGNSDWLHLYDATVLQVAVIHDGNFLKSYPWLYEIEHRLAGLACVHHCALNSATRIELPSALILNPQELGEPPDISEKAFNTRNKGFLSVQTWKSGKRIPELLRALPHAGNISKILAGTGIDYHYLTSKDKCKWPGVWDTAVSYGMEYLGVISNETRDEVLRKVTCLIDPSWGTRYESMGALYNRVMVDAIKQGAVPIARTEFIGEAWFRHDVNCLLIPKDVTPQQFGKQLNEYCNLEYSQYRRLCEAGQQLLPLFDRKVIAQQFIDLARKELPTTTGVTAPTVIESSRVIMNEFFGRRA